MDKSLASAISDAMRMMRAESATGLSVPDELSLIGAQTRSSLIDSIFSHLPEFVWIKDLQSRFVIVNPALAIASGFGTPEEMIGKTDFDIHDLETASVYFEQEQLSRITSIVMARKPR